MTVALRFQEDPPALLVLDQTRLPSEEAWLALRSSAEVVEAIRRLAVRGAPNLGIAGGYGVALAALAGEDVAAAAAALRVARPTAVNLAAAVDRVLAAARPLAEARAIEAEEDAASAAIAAYGAALLDTSRARRILTHCNAGGLATGGRGSALGCVLALAERAEGVEVLVCETRPLLQGARLTVWELARAGVPHALLADGAAAGLMARGEVDAVVVGCDRVAANGDVANKVGTYAHALAARAAGLPFLVAGPTSTIDLATASGSDIVVEERDAGEVRHAGGTLVTLPGTPVRNPAFDITPAEYVTALVTERGIAAPVDGASLAALLGAGVEAEWL